MSESTRLLLRVTDLRCEARDVLVLELKDPTGAQLPAFDPGSHLEVRLPNQLVRHYSIWNCSSERDRYCLGIGLARDSRGGSRYIHQQIRVGMDLTVSSPRNNFPLVLEAPEYVFIAGGIGITPIMAMIRNCERRNKPWRLFYCARNRQRTAFYEELRQLDEGRCHFHFDDEQNGCLFDASSALAEVPLDAHIYTCGPTPLMKAVEAATVNRAPDRVHFEWFTAAATDTSTDREFTVILNSGARLKVPAGRSILEVLEDSGCGVPYSCREGLCATCRTPVISGTPDHRDSVLSASEKAQNDQMMICVSRAISDELVLDL